MTIVLALGSEIIVFVLNWSGIVSAMRLYDGSIILGCGGYVLMKSYQIIRDRKAPGAIWALIGIAAGGAGFLLLRHFSCEICAVFGQGAIEGFWYWLSDVSMFFLMIYVLKSRPASEPALQSKDKELLASATLYGVAQGDYAAKMIAL